MITKEEVVALADTMAAAASQLSAMTYDTLMQARQQLVEQVAEVYRIIEQNKQD